MADNSRGSIRTLNTVGLQNVEKTFHAGIKELDDSRNEFFRISNSIMDCWEGEAKKEFSIQFSLLSRQYDDLADELYNIYDAVLEAETTYVDTDIALKKQFMIEGT